MRSVVCGSQVERENNYIESQLLRAWTTQWTSTRRHYTKHLYYVRDLSVTPSHQARWRHCGGSVGLHDLAEPQNVHWNYRHLTRSHAVKVRSGRQPPRWRHSFTRSTTAIFYSCEHSIVSSTLKQFWNSMHTVQYYREEHSASVVLSWCTLWHFSAENLLIANQPLLRNWPLKLLNSAK